MGSGAGTLLSLWYFSTGSSKLGETLVFPRPPVKLASALRTAFQLGADPLFPDEKHQLLANEWCEVTYQRAL